jgi:hypothetical protein
MEQVPKIVISNDADQQLETMLMEVNDGFASGRVKKAQLASWVISYFHAEHFAKQVEKIRADHFDEIAHLEAVVKQMKEAKKNDASVELDKLLSPLRGHRKPKSVVQDTSRDVPSK